MNKRKKKYFKHPVSMFVVRTCTKGPNQRGVYIVKARCLMKKGIGRIDKEVTFRYKVNKGDKFRITSEGPILIPN